MSPRQELRGERSGIRYVIGTRVRVQVSRVDLDGRRIDFRLVGDEDVPGAARNPREKASAAPSGGARSAPAGKRRPPLDIEDAGRGSLGGGGSQGELQVFQKLGFGGQIADAVHQSRWQDRQSQGAFPRGGPDLLSNI
jgi:hypothetical protein